MTRTVADILRLPPEERMGAIKAYLDEPVDRRTAVTRALQDERDAGWPSSQDDDDLSKSDRKRARSAGYRAQGELL